jgi:serine/threonine protein kinase/5-hydroxyisourate hydrolase-like protein (transthyretin family)
MVETSKVLGGKYQIITEIKKGGFGIVYYGFDKNLGKAVAIKEIAPELLEEAKYIDMFQAEARNAAKLNHHNIVHIFDLLKTPDGHFYIVMEYVDGVDLYKIIKRSKQAKKKLSINLATYIVGEVCKALEYAHNRKDMISGEPLNLIHQDISPSNIMVSMQGDVKVIDFGIARVRNERNSQNVVVTGKIPYMSPEQLNGGYFIDGRSDIYSLAVVFYELMTGTRLFQGKSEAEIIEQIRHEKTDLHVLREIQVPETLQHIISRALQHDIGQRYQSANQMYLDLAQYLMVSSKTIELSEELGALVKELFYALDPDTVVETPPVELPDNNHGGNNAPINLNITDDESLTLATPDDFANNFSGSKGKHSFSINDSLLNSPIHLEPEFNLEHPFPEEPEPENDFSEPPTQDLLEFSPNIKKTGASTEIPLELEPNFKVELPAPTSTLRPDNPTPAVSPTTETPLPRKTTIDSFSPSFIPAPAKERVEEEGDDEIKTIIDVVRLTSRSYKKQILAGFLGVLFVFLLFFSLDTMFRVTGVGKQIYNYIFPPAIKIVSYPEGARIYLDDDLIEGETPLSIQKISPGVHKLRLVKAGFPAIVKSITVPEKGEIKVEGGQKTAGSDAYVFRFMTRIEIQSNPAAATVIINNTRLSQTTPCELQWEAGKPLSIELEKEGFQRLSGFSFNLADLEKENTENRFWKVTKQNHQKDVKYIVQGLFRKLVQVHSSPAGASIYIDDDVKPAGITGSKSIIHLTLGEHLITVKLNGFIQKSVTLNVSETSVPRVSFIFQRPVKFQSRSAHAMEGSDLGATLVYLKQNGTQKNFNQATPFELTLDAVSYQALFRKSGYDDALITISPAQKTVVVPMKSGEVPVEVIVTDAASGKPVPNVQVYYQPMNDQNATEIFMEVTDANGSCQKSIPPGQYIFKVVKNGYFQRRSNYTTSTQGRNRIRFNLVAQ